MLVSKKHKALVLRTRDPERILSVIPKAKRLVHKGKEFIAVRHGIEEVRVLRNLGFEAPSPIKYHYDWPGRFKPFYAQREAAEFMSLYNRAYNLSSIGTGKTLATLWSFDFLRSQGVVRKALVVCPLSTLERTWADEVFQHFPHLTTAVLHGSREKRLALLNEDVDIYLINHDGLKVRGMVEAFADRPDINLIVVDELSQAARNAGTERYKALHTIINRQKIPRAAWGLTGTPIPNGPTDAWAQCRLLTPETVPPYFGRFRDLVEKQITPFLWVPKDDALAVVHKAMQPAIRFSRDECVDLPPCIYQTRQVALTEPQRRAYKEMLTKLSAEIDGGEVTAVNEAIKAQKLLQICSGSTYDASGASLELDASPRLEVVREIIEESGSKVLVFVPFRNSLDAVVRFLEKHFSVAVVHGGVSKHERDGIFTAFQKMSDPLVLVAQPASLSHGLTLTAASTIVWYTAITSSDTHTQANGRITRPGQKLSQLIVHIEGSEVERRYFDRLRKKQRVEGALLDMIKESRGELVRTD